jgi:hypothetical protein
MDIRVANILGQIRLNLKQISIQNIVDGELFYQCNEAQRQILLETLCLEKTFDIQFQAGISEYDFFDENTINIKKIFTSWQGNIKYVLNIDWEKYKYTTGSNPYYCTIFSNKIYFAPIPQASTDTAEIWAYQTDIIDEMTVDISPEVPRICDRAIVSWVTAQYTEDQRYYAEYLRQLRLINKVHAKTSMPKENNSSLLGDA